MAIGDFRSPDLDYKGWLELVKESSLIKINSPANNETFFTDLGKSKKEITISGFIRNNKKGKILVIIRTDRDYPQALGEADDNGKWSFPGCTLGGVDHQIYAVVVNSKDKPLFRSKVITVRLQR